MDWQYEYFQKHLRHMQPDVNKCVYKYRLQKMEATMNRKMIFLAILILALASLACSVNINLPDWQTVTGPTETENINVPLPSDSQTISDVTLKFGAGTLKLQPGAEAALVSGTATYNVAELKPVVSSENGNVLIQTGNFNLKGIPNLNNQDIINDWELKLGASPMRLVINAGAYQGNYELGGLALKRLQIEDGAAQVDVSFSTPNLAEMTSLQYTTGASKVSLTGLANANTTDMTFRGGAGEYTLDFSGELRNNMDVNIESGVSSVTVIVPEGVNAKVISDSGFMTVSTSGSWEKNGNTYQLTGSGNTITINVKMGAGNLKLETSR
jgi:hypothetical protein